VLFATTFSAIGAEKQGEFQIFLLITFLDLLD